MDIGLDALRGTALWVLIGIAVLALVLAVIIKKVIGKIVVLAIAATLVFFGWQQRDHALDFANQVRGETCAQQPTFFGVTVSLPESWCEPA
ncbi:hypothetical protein JL107_13925 [Nakamurella flavida]|uniref:Uncharacterized protein n=1 Tax=Nakamurella flavida TaxID=363630 RepID=A0A938YQI4_9ACTN|nr:hypothetical protein [Nakamurella flavida]MBM9477544.1 hypothetical protein [Nakamurella flavida]MDP9779092.1 hypothetical protein [Nakamurella flavida]